VDIEIRAAEPGEEQTLLEACGWLFAPPGSRPGGWDPAHATAELRRAIDSDHALVLVAADAGGRIVGFCTAYLGPPTIRFGLRAWVEELAVHPEQRSRGIGAGLLEATRAWARERGATHLKLDTAVAREDAQRFYERERPSSRSLSYTWEL
jgi:GNAT superfamily N-acetyltransferase